MRIRLIIATLISSLLLSGCFWNSSKDTKKEESSYKPAPIFTGTTSGGGGVPLSTYTGSRNH